MGPIGFPNSVANAHAATAHDVAFPSEVKCLNSKTVDFTPQEWLAPGVTTSVVLTEPEPVSTASSTSEQLILAAERLFAEQGIDGVSLRKIGAEAQNANNSAVRYHFGSKEGLIQAILEYRIPGLNRRRQLLAAQIRRGDLRSCVEAYLLPIVEEAEAEDSYYMSFLVQLQCCGIGEHPFERLPERFRATTEGFIGQICDLLPDLPPSVRSSRIEQALLICVHASADRERARHYGSPVTSYPLHVAGLFDGIIGFLQAPVSAATLDALGAFPRPVARRPR
jgi:AcrR family transcriptional regulator